MNYTPITKLIAEFRTGNKLLDIYVWAYIKLCSNYQTYISDITQEKLSELTGIPLRTIGSSIKRLKDGDYLEVRTRKIESEGYRLRNSYHFKREIENFLLVHNDFFHKGYTPKIAGFMLLLRAITLNNTNQILWTKTKIAEAIGVGRNTVASLLNECQALGLIKEIPKGYEIIEPCLLYTAVNNKVKSPIYMAICDFCRSKGIAPPVWDKDAISVISAKYSLEMPPDNEFNLISQLEKRCKRLPKEVTLSYFIKVLNMDKQYEVAKAVKTRKIKQAYAF